MEASLESLENIEYLKYLENFQYNSVLILSFFFISLAVLILKWISGGITNDLFFSTYRSSPFSPLTYVRLITHILGHQDWKHFSNNFIYILLIGPIIEEKYGTIELLIMMIITAVVIGLLNSLLSKNKILGASGIVFMLITLSSFVNIQVGKIPITLVLIFIFYIVNEILDGLFKKDNVSHMGHLIGAVCGIAFGFYFM